MKMISASEYAQGGRIGSCTNTFRVRCNPLTFCRDMKSSAMELILPTNPACSLTSVTLGISNVSVSSVATRGSTAAFVVLSVTDVVMSFQTKIQFLSHPFD